jgi:hypothetical protein
MGRVSQFLLLLEEIKRDLRREPVTVSLRLLVVISEIKLLKLVVVKHHTAPGYRGLLAKGLSQLHHMRSDPVSLGLISHFF